MYAWNEEHHARDLPRLSSWESTSSEQELSSVAEDGNRSQRPPLGRTGSWMNQSSGFGFGGGVPICRNCGAQGALALGNPASPGGKMSIMSSQAGSRRGPPPGAKQVDNKRLVFVTKLASGASGSVDKYKYVLQRGGAAADSLTCSCCPPPHAF